MRAYEITVNADGTATECASGLVLACSWFARCSRPAAGLVAHPILGAVPTCARCATVSESTLRPFDRE